MIQCHKKKLFSVHFEMEKSEVKCKTEIQLDTQPQINLLSNWHPYSHLVNRNSVYDVCVSQNSHTHSRSTPFFIHWTHLITYLNMVTMFYNLQLLCQQKVLIKFGSLIVTMKSLLGFISVREMDGSARIRVVTASKINNLNFHCEYN